MKKPAAKFNTVMLIDDNEIDNFINQKMIEGFNFADKIYIHSSGKSALEFLYNLDRNETIDPSLIPQIIFLDINMPLMDGFQFLEQLKKFSDKILKDLKIIMLTTSINPSDIERSKENQFVTKFVNKPLTKPTLEGITNNFTAKNNG